jgi:hypothetical protein
MTSTHVSSHTRTHGVTHLSTVLPYSIPIAAGTANTAFGGVGTFSSIWNFQESSGSFSPSIGSQTWSYDSGGTYSATGIPSIAADVGASMAVAGGNRLAPDSQVLLNYTAADDMILLYLVKPTGGCGVDCDVNSVGFTYCNIRTDNLIEFATSVGTLLNVATPATTNGWFLCAFAIERNAGGLGVDHKRFVVVTDTTTTLSALATDAAGLSVSGSPFVSVFGAGSATMSAIWYGKGIGAATGVVGSLQSSAESFASYIGLR